MRASMIALIGGLLISTPSFAQNNTASYSPGGNYIGDPLAWAYGSRTNLQERQQVLKRVREVCDSRAYSDKVRCSNALSIIKAGYEELQTRRAAQSAVAD